MKKREKSAGGEEREKKEPWEREKRVGGKERGKRVGVKGREQLGEWWWEYKNLIKQFG